MDGPTIEHDLARPWLKEPGDGAEGGGFSGAVSADEGHDFAGLDAKRDAAERFDRTVEDAEVFDFEQSHALHRGGIGTQVGGDDLGIVLNFVRGAVRDDLAVIEHGDLFADIHDEAHIVFDEQDGEVEGIADVSD